MGQANGGSTGLQPDDNRVLNEAGFSPGQPAELKAPLNCDEISLG